MKLTGASCLGGSGNGEAIVANRVPGVRCTLCWNAESARYGREHNDSNVLSMGQRLVSWETAREVVDVWLTTEFEGGRHLRRINRIDEEPQRLTHHRSFKGNAMNHCT